jgi:hypothetical protein
LGGFPVIVKSGGGKLPSVAVSSPQAVSIKADAKDMRARVRNIPIPPYGHNCEAEAARAEPRYVRQEKEIADT